MDCKICEIKQRQFVCETCLKTEIAPILSQTHALSTTLAGTTLPKSVQALETTMHPARILRAQVSSLARSVDEMKEGLAKLRRDNTRKRDQLRMMREGMAERRRMLEAARLQLLPSSSSSNCPTPTLPSSSSPQHNDLNPVSTSSSTPTLLSAPSLPQTPTPSNPPLTSTSPALLALSQSIARARSGLVQELVEVFNVVEVGGRPPIGGKAGTKGEWTIGDLILPVPGDMRRYPPDHINAVLTHTIHFITLLTFYLGIKLPFEVVWTGPPSSSSSSSSTSTTSPTSASTASSSPSSSSSPPTSSSYGKLGVGQPWIGAARGVGGESGGWARWYTKHPLHLSSSSLSAIPNGSTSKSHPRHPRTSSSRTPSSHSTAHPGSGSAIDASIISSSPPTSATQASFMTGLAMLLYDVSYLAWTQNVDVPLSQAGEVLSNLWSVCCSSELGKKSHESYPLTPPPTPASFPLDFAQLLQVTTANPTRRPRGSAARERYPGIKPFSVGVGVGGGGNTNGDRKRAGVVAEGEEGQEDDQEDEWHLVDEDVYDV